VDRSFGERSENSLVGGFRAAGPAAAAVTALGVVGLAAPAYADQTVTVQGTAFPDPAVANLSFVGCGDLYQRTDEPLEPTIGLGPGVARAGTRSLGWDLAGGNAVGAVYPVASMLSTTTASIAVNAADQATGVAYAGYQAPADAGTSMLWIGRAELATPGGAWQTIDATGRLYTWTEYDMTTRTEVGRADDVPSTVAAFAAAHGGDGPGLYTIGFGCDGTPFSMDALEVGGGNEVTTYDVEGLRTSVTIDAVRTQSRGEVTITGRLRTGTGDPVPNATMILERRAPGSQVWTPVQVAEVQDGAVRATVPGDEPGYYRWRFVERPLAEGSASVPLLLDVLPPDPTVSPSPTGPASHEPTGAPTSTPSASDQPPQPGTPSPSATESSSDPAASPAPSSAESSSASPTEVIGESATPSESDSRGTR
jgi:hypothetical protein